MLKLPNYIMKSMQIQSSRQNDTCLWTVRTQRFNEVLYSFLTVVSPNFLGSAAGTYSNGLPSPEDMCVLQHCKAYEGSKSPVEAHTSSLTQSLQGEVNENVYLG